MLLSEWYHVLDAKYGVRKKFFASFYILISLHTLNHCVASPKVENVRSPDVKSGVGGVVGGRGHIAIVGVADIKCQQTGKLSRPPFWVKVTY